MLIDIKTWNVTDHAAAHTVTVKAPTAYDATRLARAMYGPGYTAAQLINVTTVDFSALEDPALENECEGCS